MVTGWNNKVLYTGVTNDLVRRIHEHREKAIPGFTNRYNLNKLVFFESTADVYAAIAREKEIKGWRREKKNALVATMNPDWHDLAIEFGILDP
jgi:putative endonuclease